MYVMPWLFMWLYGRLVSLILVAWLALSDLCIRCLRKQDCILGFLLSDLCIAISGLGLLLIDVRAQEAGVLEAQSPNSSWVTQVNCVWCSSHSMILSCQMTEWYVDWLICWVVELPIEWMGDMLHLAICWMNCFVKLCDLVYPIFQSVKFGLLKIQISKLYF